MTESPFRSQFAALVWKEWREQRLIWAALLALSLAAEGVLRLTPATAPVREALLLLIPFLWGSMATLLGANAFASDRETDTESFMCELPVSRRFRFWVKIGVVAALLWATQALTALCMPETDWGRVTDSQPSYFLYYLLVSFSLAMILLSLTAACIASWASSTLSAVLQTAVVGPCLLFWMAFMGKLLYAMLEFGRPNDVTKQWSVLVITLVLAHAVMLAGACWLWTATAGCFSRHVRRAGTLLALFLLVLLAAPAVVYAREILMAPVFLEEYNWIVPSPAGEYALIYGRWPEGPWHLSERVVLLDTETSRTVRFSRLRASAVNLNGWAWSASSRGIWSPDGARFVLRISNQWAFPDGCLRYFPPWVTNYDNKTWWVDVASGEMHYVRSSTDSVEERNWWWDDHTLAFREGTGMAFQDIRTGERRFCADRVSAKESQSINFFDARVSASGIWLFSAAGDLYCYRPDVTAASIIKVQMPRSHSAQPERMVSYYLDVVSPDGRWATLTSWYSPGEVHQTICSLETGVTDEIGSLDVSLLGGALRESFTPDSKAILACGRQGVGLWDMGNRKLDMLYTASPDMNLVPGMAVLSPSGKYLLVNLRPSKPGLKIMEADMEADVVDIATKRAWPVRKSKFENWWASMTWLGDDQLVVYEQKNGADGVAVDHSLWVVSRDGTSKRKALP